jgi:MFS superfamily sulfate permease-like transporter
MNTQTSKMDHPSIIYRMLPILNWLPKYERTWLRGDMIAGLTVLALLIRKVWLMPRLPVCRPRPPFMPHRLA